MGKLKPHSVGSLVLWKTDQDSVYGHPVSMPLIVLKVWEPDPVYDQFRYQCWSFYISDWFIVDGYRLIPFTK